MSYIDKHLLFYLNQINRIPLLTRDEEYKLAVRAQKGDQKAKQRLISANLRFVVQTAKRYSNSNISILDLISEGNLGLIRAVETFDPNRGFHFISYAVHWIKQSIIKAISEKSKIIRIPLNLNNSMSHIERALREDHCGEITHTSIQAISKETQLPVKDIQSLLQLSQKHASIDKVTCSEGGAANTLKDVIEDSHTISPHEHAVEVNLKMDLQKVLGSLSSVEAEIIRLRYGLEGKAPLTLLEIGKKLNLTKERIRQIEKKAIEQLKAPVYSRKLLEYVQ